MARALVSFLALVVAVASASGRGQGTHMQVSLKGTPVLDTVVPTAGFETQHIPVTAHLYAEGSAGMGEEVRPAAHVDVQLASASAAASGLPAAGTLRFAMAKVRWRRARRTAAPPRRPLRWRRTWRRWQRTRLRPRRRCR